MLFKITADQTQWMLKQERPLLRVRTTSIHVDPSERTIKFALSPKLIKLMIPPRANPRRLDRVRVPPSTTRGYRNGVFIPLSLFDSASRFIIVSLAWLIPENRAREEIAFI